MRNHICLNQRIVEKQRRMYTTNEPIMAKLRLYMPECDSLNPGSKRLVPTLNESNSRNKCQYMISLSFFFFIKGNMTKMTNVNHWKNRNRQCPFCTMFFKEKTQAIMFIAKMPTQRIFQQLSTSLCICLIISTGARSIKLSSYIRSLPNSKMAASLNLSFR